MRSFRSQLRRAAQVTAAFWRIDFIKAMNYPLALLMKALSAFIPVITFVFVADLVGDNGPEVAYDYYTFVVIGVVTVGILAATLNSFGSDMLDLVTQGQLEMFLVEPVRWTLLPFAMTPWAAFQAFVTSALMILLSIPLGAEYRLEAVPLAILIVILGLAATLAIGILGASIKIISKKADPVLSLYTLAASVLSGVFFPVEVLAQLAARPGLGDPPHLRDPGAAPGADAPGRRTPRPDRVAGGACARSVLGGPLPARAVVLQPDPGIRAQGRSPERLLMHDPAPWGAAWARCD